MKPRRSTFLLLRYLLVALAIGLGASGPSHAAPITPSDPYYSSHQWYGPRLGLPEAWGISTGSAAVTVAIVDSGVISTTPDLAGRVLPPIQAGGPTPLNDTQLASSARLRHGTNVAGVAAMAVNNGLHGAGVGDFSIQPVGITNVAGLSNDTALANGIRLAADSGARVINVSYSASNYYLIDAAAEYALSKGSLVFIAAGNSNVNMSFAASELEHLIFVAGTNALDERWGTRPGDTEGSNFGWVIDISAPADDVLVLDPTLPNGVGLGDGTSFATPLVAGAAALAWSINPLLSPLEVRDLLYSTAVDLGAPGHDPIYGHGRLDVGALAAAALATVPEPSTVVLLTIGGLFAIAARRRRKSG